MCHSCRDISDTVQTAKKEFGGYYLPNGLKVQTSALFNTSVTPVGLGDPSHPEGPWIRTGMIEFQGLAMVDKDPMCQRNETFCDIKPVAFECWLQPCVKTFAANFTNMVYHEEELSRQHLHYLPQTVGYQLALNRTMYNGTWKECHSTDTKTDTNAVQVPMPDAQNFYNRQPSRNYTSVWYPPECVYALKGPSSLAMQNFLRGLFEGDGVVLQFIRSLDALDGPFWLQTLYHGGKLNMSSIDKDIEGLATAISAQIRTYADGPDSLKYATGETLRMDTCIHVSWGFLAFPATLLGLELLFFGAVLFTNYRSAWNSDWKSSSLALVFQSLGHPGSEKGASEQALLDAARLIHVRFAQVEGRWQLSRDGTT
jgi:hypothetical protein